MFPNFFDDLIQQAMKMEPKHPSSTIIFSQKIEKIVDGKGNDISENLIDNVLVQMNDIKRPIIVNDIDIYELDELAGSIAYNARVGGISASYI